MVPDDHHDFFVAGGAWPEWAPTSKAPSTTSRAVTVSVRAGFCASPRGERRDVPPSKVPDGGLGR